MAKFPGGLFRGPLSSRVRRPASPDISLAGQKGRALQQVGAGVEQLGRGVQKYMDQKEKSDAVMYKSSVLNKVIQDIGDFQKQAELNAGEAVKKDEKATYKGLSTSVLQELNNKREEALSRAPSDLARQEIELGFDSLETQIKAKATRSELQLNTSLAKSRRRRELETSRSYQFSNPDLGILNEQIMNGTRADLESRYFSEADIKIHQKLQGSVVEASVKGMIHKGGGSNLNNAEAFISGRTQHKAAFNLLSSEEKAFLKDAIDRKRVEELSVNMYEGINKAQNRLDVYKNNPSDTTQLDRLGEDITALEIAYAALDKPRPNLRKQLDNFKATVASSDVLKQIPGKTSAEIGAMLKEIQASDVNNSFDLKVKEAKQAMVLEYDKKMREDPVAVMMVETANKMGTTAMGEAIKLRGYEPRYYDNRSREIIEHEIKNHPGGLTQGLGNFMKDTKWGTADVKTKFINQVGFKDKSLATAALAIHSNYETQKILLETNAADVNRNFKDFGFTDDDVTLMKSRLVSNDSFDMFRRSFTRNIKNSGYMQAVNEAVMVQAKHLMTQGVGRNAAIDKAVETIIPGNITFVEGVGDDSYPLMGKYFDQDTRVKIQAFVDNTKYGLHTKEFMEGVGVDFTANLKKGSSLNVDQALDKINMLNPRYEINSTLDGFVITVDDPQNRSIRRRLKTFSKDVKGNDIEVPVEIPFDSILDPAEGLYKLKTNVYEQNKVIGTGVPYFG